MRSMWFMVWLVACGGQSKVDTAADSDVAPDTDVDTEVPPDTDTEVDTDTDAVVDEPTAGELYLDGSGTIDGGAFTFVCRVDAPPGWFYATQTTDGAGNYLLGGACADETGAYSINIGVLLSGPQAGSACVANSWGIQVVSLTGGGSYNCALDGASTFHIDVDEMSVEADGGVTWGGVFEVRGNGNSLAVDLSGDFRFHSAP